MSDLYLTPTRRRRLEQVERGEHYRDDVAARHKPTGHLVNAEIASLLAAGWIEDGPHPVHAGWIVYRLTEVGRRLLYPPPVADIAPGSVWLDQLNKGRRLRVEHVDEIQVSVLATYSPAPDAWQYTLTADVIPRGEWTAHRYVPESTSDGAR